MPPCLCWTPPAPTRPPTPQISPDHLLAPKPAPRQQQLSRRAALAAGLALGLAGPSEASDEAARVQAAYDSYAGSYDALDGGALAGALGLEALRRALLAQASGRCLEVGVGTGLNLPLYPPDRITSLTALDLSGAMLQEARRKGAARPAGSFPIDYVQGDVTSLPFPPGAFDTALSTFSLCVFPDPLGALRGLGRVLRPGGQLLLLEHSRSELPPLGWYQDVTVPAVAALGKGCVWNQRVEALVGAAGGLRVVEARRHLAGLFVSLRAQRETE